LDAAEARQAADFLGAVFAFLEFARPDSQPKLRHARKLEVEKRLGQHFAKDFAGGAASVAAVIARLEAERQAVVDKQTAAAAAERDQAQAAINEQQDAIATRQQALQGDAQQVDAQRREQQKLATQLRSLQDARDKLTRDIEQLVRQFPDSDRDDTSSQQRRFRLMTELQPLQVQAQQIDAEMAGLQTRVAALAGAIHAGTAQLRAGALDQRKAQRRVNLAGKRLEDRQPPAVRPGPPLGKLAQFSTYAELPYQQEKTRILDGFAR
jgi:chromosome segregation ATPase